MMAYANVISEEAVVMNQRQVDLLTNLCASTTHTAVKRLAIKYRVSRKTIYKDLDVIDSYLSKTQLQLERKQRIGVKIIGTGVEKKRVITNLYADKKAKTFIEDNMSPAKRRIELVKNIILNDQHQTLKQLSNKWIVSKTSIINDIGAVNNILRSNSSGITSNGEFLEFVGNNRQRQNAVATFIVSITNNRNKENDKLLAEFFPLKLIQSVNETFAILKRKWFSDLPAYYLYALRIITMAQIDIIIRSKKKHNSNDNDDPNETKSLTLAKELFSMVSDRLPFNFDINDIEDLTNNFAAYRIGIHSPESNVEWKLVVDELMTRMESIQKMDFLGWSRLRNQLMYHIPAMVLRLQQGMTVQNPLLNDIKRQYPALFGMTWYALSFLEEKFKISLNDDEVSFITIYFHVALNENITRNNVLVVFGVQDQLINYVKSQIEQLLPTNTKVVTTTVDEFNSISLDAVGLIVEVKQLPFIVKVPQVTISPFMDKNDQAKILTAFAENVILQKSKKQVQFKTLKKVLKKDLIFWKKEMKDKKQVLNFLVDTLNNKNIVNSDFKESIFRREKLGSTELAGGTALPHAAPETVNKLAIAILVLQKPVWWNTQKVNIVVITCVPNSEIKIYRELVLDVYELVENKQMVSLITGLRSTTKLLKLLND